MTTTINDMREANFGEIISRYVPDEMNNELFANLRVFIDENGDFWFIGSEVASIMGYTDTRHAIQDHVPDVYKRTITRNNGFLIETKGPGQKGGPQMMIIISEMGLYSLAMRSRLPKAHQFQDWIYRVLTKIRQCGGYINPNLRQVVDRVPEPYRQAFTNMIDMKNRMIDEMRPKADFYDRAMTSNAVSMTDVAKDFGMSANELHNILYKLGIIYRVSDTWVLYKQYQGKGYTATKSLVSLKDQYGELHNDVEIATYWTEMGRGFIYGVLGANNIFPLVEK